MLRNEAVMKQCSVFDSASEMDENLFDKFQCDRHIKELILLLLAETEIHSLMSRVSSEWNAICTSTYNDSRFKYTFKKYFTKLVNSGENVVNTTVYVECPWNRLWQYGKIIDSDNSGITINIQTKYDDPFDKDTKTDKSFGFKNSLFFANLDKEENSESIYFGGEYHHIAPINTIDKYRTVKNTNDKFIRDLIDKKIQTGYKDHFDRILIDVDGYYATRNCLLWHIDGEYNSVEHLHGYFKKDAFICGILDMNALNIMFPKWNNGGWYQIPVLFDITSTLLSETRLPSNVKLLASDRKIVVDKIPDSCKLKFQNVWQYGTNRFFSRIWIHPNDRHLFDSFGVKSGQEYQLELVATPAMNNIGINDVSEYNFMQDSRLTWKEILESYCVGGKDKDWNINDDIESEIARLKTLTDFDELKQSIKYKNKLIALGSSTCSLWEILCIQDSRKNNKYHTSIYHFDQVTNSEPVSYEEKLNLRQLFDFDSIHDDELINKKLGNCFRLNTTISRPIINFDIEKNFVKQYDNYYQLPFYTKERIELIEQLLTHEEIQVSWITNPELDNYAIFLVQCKPKFIGLRDKDWMKMMKESDNDSKQSILRERMKKYNSIYTNKNIYALKVQEWKLGMMIIDEIENRQNVIKEFYDNIGQSTIYIDITKEFDQFQNDLKKSWLLAYPDKNENDWDNRKYFVNDEMNAIIYNDNKKNDKQVFAQFCAHLDDATVVKPL